MKKEIEKVDENLVLIDADSIIYIIGSELAEMQLEPLGIMKLDEFLSDILITTGSKHYQGFFGGPGHNFRKNVATTKVYKGNRPTEKPDWFTFWSPILKKRMEEHWNFQVCANIEADDACAIAANKYRDIYNKVTIASPDKDLYQIPDVWFYDYTKRTTLFCPETVALEKFCTQMIVGDSTDNIPGCFGAGPGAAKLPVAEIMEKGLGFDEAMAYIKEFYVKWNTVTLRAKQAKKQEKAFLDQYKIDNDISRLTKDIKSTALKNFVVDTSMLLDTIESKKLFKEQYQLIKLIDNEAEGNKHKFKLGGVIENTTIDWDSIDIFELENEELEEEQDFDFIDDL
jgi:5'-3' exonuclease